MDQRNAMRLENYIPNAVKIIQHLIICYAIKIGTRNDIKSAQSAHHDNEKEKKNI